MTQSNRTFKNIAYRESVLLASILVGSLILLPVAVYVVGKSIFGEYSGTGIGDFYSRLYSGVFSGDDVVLFLFLSPYLGLQVLRVTAWTFRRLGQQAKS